MFQTPSGQKRSTFRMATEHSSLNNSPPHNIWFRHMYFWVLWISILLASLHLPKKMSLGGTLTGTGNGDANGHAACLRHSRLFLRQYRKPASNTYLTRLSVPRSNTAVSMSQVLQGLRMAGRRFVCEVSGRGYNAFMLISSSRYMRSIAAPTTVKLTSRAWCS